MKVKFVDVGFFGNRRKLKHRLKCETANIAAKKTEITQNFPNTPISSISSSKYPGTADIAVKKKIKYLTFYYHCVRNDWIMNMNNIEYRRKWRYRCLFLAL
jgi:hypothetical protein